MCVYILFNFQVDPLVYNMSHEDPGDVTYSAIGGLQEQIRQLREVSWKKNCQKPSMASNCMFFTSVLFELL